MLEYLWFLPLTLMCANLLIVFIRREMPERTKQKFLLVNVCVLILMIPFEDPPISYLTSALTVIYVWMSFSMHARTTPRRAPSTKRTASPRPASRE